MIKVTTLMASRWIKAVFLAILGILILLFADKLVRDLRTMMEDDLDVAFEWTWDLITWLLWVLVAWLFVDAALTVALSFSERRYTLLDVMRRLDRIEKKLGIVEPTPKPVEPEPVEEETVEEAAPEEEVPPPPKE